MCYNIDIYDTYDIYYAYFESFKNLRNFRRTKHQFDMLNESITNKKQRIFKQKQPN